MYRPIFALAAALVLAIPAAAQTAAPKPAAAAKPAAAPTAAAPATPKAAPADASPDVTAVRQLLNEKFPGADVRHVAKTPYFGLYEAMFDDRLVYTDAKVTYVLVGSIYDTATKQNLTEERSRKLNRVALSDLPLNLAMKKVKGDGSRKLVVFSDADCPFCARLEQTLKDVDNVTIYTFLFPIDQLHPDAARKSRIIWCAPDRQKAWDQYFADGTLPDNKGDCATPLNETAALGQKLRVTATPTLVFADGSIVPGALPLPRLEQELKNAEIEAKKLAAAKKPS